MESVASAAGSSVADRMIATGSAGHIFGGEEQPEVGEVSGCKSAGDPAFKEVCDVEVAEKWFHANRTISRHRHNSNTCGDSVPGLH